MPPDAATTIPNSAAAILGASRGSPAAPTPMATIDSPRATIMISPCRSTKWAGERRHPRPCPTCGLSSQRRARRPRERALPPRRRNPAHTSSDGPRKAPGAHRRTARRSSGSSRPANTNSTRCRARTRNAAFLGIDRVRQPRVRPPRPPQRSKKKRPAQQSFPGLVDRKEAGDLGDGEDEDEVEEELERRDPLVAIDRTHVHQFAPATGLFGAARADLLCGLSTRRQISVVDPREPGHDQVDGQRHHDQRQHERAGQRVPAHCEWGHRRDADGYKGKDREPGERGANVNRRRRVS